MTRNGSPPTSSLAAASSASGQDSVSTRRPGRGADKARATLAPTEATQLWLCCPLATRLSDTVNTKTASIGCQVPESTTKGRQVRGQDLGARRAQAALGKIQLLEPKQGARSGQQALETYDSDMRVAADSQPNDNRRC
mmetsp:Transcript_94657/g.271511  ORF Transcript_94657/g.271511 Transcript_94657/m.271511 type:complete len:138 (+) Transcript_94657:81-494(+)